WRPKLWRTLKRRLSHGVLLQRRGRREVKGPRGQRKRAPSLRLRPARLTWSRAKLLRPPRGAYTVRTCMRSKAPELRGLGNRSPDPTARRRRIQACDRYRAVARPYPPDRRKAIRFREEPRL